MTAPLIQISDLCKSYDGIEALCDLHLQLNRGEIVGLLGPNGAGKTTAIQMILGLLTPTSGSVSVLGLNPIHHLHKLSKQVNFSSAYGNLPSNLTVNESLTVFSRLYNISNAKEKMKSLLALFEIADLGTRVAPQSRQSPFERPHSSCPRRANIKFGSRHGRKGA
jgi:ABC-2 type transport system ATP-binding protein